MSLLRTPHLLLGAAVALHVFALLRILDTDTGRPGSLATPSAIALPETPPPPELTAVLGGRLFGGSGDEGVAADASPPADVAAAAPPPPPPAPPSLAGTATGGRRTAVAILRSAAGTSRMLRIGESIDGWRVIAITGSRVTVRNGSDTRELSLARRGEGETAANVTNAGAGSASPNAAQPVDEGTP